MTTLANGVSEIKEAKAVSIIQTIVYELRKAVENEGNCVKTTALNTALQNLTFDYHPSEVGKRSL